MAASERNYATILASIGEGVVATDPQGRITFMNRVAEGLTGRQLAHVRGQGVEHVVPLIAEGSGRLVENPGLRAMRDKQPVTLPEPSLLVAEDGNRIPVDDTAAPILDEDGALYFPAVPPTD
jgi:PAS domain S-box-containing protein